MDAARVAALTGAAVARVAPLHGGCIAAVSRVDLADGRVLVVKAGSAGLDVEGRMLADLAAAGLPVPPVVHAAPDLLLLAFMPGESRFDAAAERHAAELLAALHAHTAPTHGYASATLIAGLPLPNPPMADWPRFYGEHRLLAMADPAARAGRLSPQARARLDRLLPRLPALLAPGPPALLHGDVWTTNVLARGGRITAFLDPAISYGHAEVELAFIMLFNSFGRPFFDAYQALRPLEPGFFRDRAPLYQLYPLLVHARLFGGHYGAEVDAILRRYVA